MTVTLADEDLWNHVRRVFVDAIAKLKTAAEERGGGHQIISQEERKKTAKLATGHPVESPIPYATLDGLAALVEAVKSREVTEEKFELELEWNTFEVMPHEVATIPLVLAAQYIDQYGFDVDEGVIRAVYEPYERYLLAEQGTLRADIAVPILGAILPATESETDKNCSIIDFDDCWRSTFNAADLSERDAKIASAATQLLLVKQTEVYVESFGYYHHMSASGVSIDKVERFFESLCIEAPGSTTWVQMAIVSRSWSAKFPAANANTELITTRDYAARIDSVTRRYSYDPYHLTSEQAQTVLRNKDRLVDCHKSVRVATGRLVSARASRSSDEDRIIDLCIGLEALLGSGSGEIVHRISMRGAAMLKMLGWHTSAVNYKAIRELYDYRSRVVHGEPGPYKKSLLDIDGDPIHSSRFATAALCSLLRHALLNYDVFDPSKIDEMLIFPAFDTVASLLEERQAESGEGLGVD